MFYLHSVRDLTIDLSFLVAHILSGGRLGKPMDDFASVMRSHLYPPFSQAP
jgi:hypothetical protein